MKRDPIELEIFKNLYHSIAEEMGAALRRTAFSPNIKERRDYSCAVFAGTGEVVAMGDHMERLKTGEASKILVYPNGTR